MRAIPPTAIPHRTLLAGAGLVALTALAGCSVTVDRITRPAVGTVGVEQGRATIVIVQPNIPMRDVNVLDSSGQLVGQITGLSRTTIRVPAGSLRLYALRDDLGWTGDRIDGEAQAGKTYYATIGGSSGWAKTGKWGGLRFMALTPRSGNNRWAGREQYLASTPAVEMDPARIAAAQRQLGDTTKLMREIDSFADGLSGQNRVDRTILAADGL
jgi:hypothetical protein